jgi:tricarballylate dehydrogenase
VDELFADVLVVGSGNAGLCAALSALEQGARVVMVEKAPKHLRGGNSAYTALYRFAYEGLNDLRDLSTFDDELADKMVVDPYPPRDFLRDLLQTSGGRANHELMETLANESYAVMKWMHEHGLQFEPSIDGSREHDGKFYWQPGVVLRPVGLGAGMLNVLFDAVSNGGGDIHYEAQMIDLTFNERGELDGVIIKTPASIERVHVGAVILASGGFEASPEMRARYLGPGWDLAKVRGTRYNTGEALEVALRHGAASAGEWSGCHATMVHAIASSIEMGEEVLFPLSYPFGIIVDGNGERFTDEGANYFMQTYAKLGKEILNRPGGVAFQIFDAKTAHLLKGEGAGQLAYAVPHHTANSIEELAVMAGLPSDQFQREVDRFNSAIVEGEFDASILDDKHTSGLSVDKSNWALPIDTPPFEAFPVECGITFTYGGLSTDVNGQVIDTSGKSIRGLYAVGEIAGTFFSNYAGGSGLTKGAVFGRRAGVHAASNKEIPKES